VVTGARSLVVGPVWVFVDRLQFYIQYVTVVRHVANFDLLAVLVTATGPARLSSHLVLQVTWQTST